MEFSMEAARAMLIAAQGLDAAPGRPAEKGDVLGAVRRMGVLQIDSISVVARSPYLVLWSRLGSYEPRWLDELLAVGISLSTGPMLPVLFPSRITGSTGGG